MFTRFFSCLPFLLALAVTLTLTACDSLTDAGNTPLSAADAELMERVVADALADETEGLVAEVYDLTAGVSETSLTYVGTDQAAYTIASDPEPRRGGQRNYTVTYDPETGEHTIQYERSVETPRFNKAVGATLVYLFTDLDGGFIAFPRRERANVAAIDFEGIRSGSVESTRGPAERTWSRAFEQDAAWQLTGLDSGSDLIAMEGTQLRTGTAAYTDDTGAPVTVDHEVALSAVDVTILKPSSADVDVERRITGTLAYTATVEKTVGDVTTVMTDEGTIELDGNGRALLRFLGLKKIVRIGLRDGHRAGPQDA